MKVLYCYWGENSAYDTIINLGKVTDESDYLLKTVKEYLNGSVEEELVDKITDDIDVVFSYDFFPVISRVCNRKDKIYLSWVYDWPHLTLYQREIYNKCNRIYLFEKDGITSLNKLGVSNVRYMPLVVDTERLDIMLGDDIGSTVYDYDVSFVGNLYMNKENTLTIEKIPDYYSGYLDAIINVQQKIFGYNIVNELVSEEFAAKYLRDAGSRVDGFITSDNVVLAGLINKAVTGAERRNIINTISSKYKLDLFTSNTDEKFKNIIIHGPVSYINEMPVVFRKSRINLNMTLRSITTGVPLRVIDILGAGGFCLTNYQEGILEHFEDGKDLVMYTSVEDLMEKIGYYLKHDDERRNIACNGHEKIKKYNYVNALSSMLYAEDIEPGMDKIMLPQFIKIYYLDYIHKIIVENKIDKNEYRNYCAMCRTIDKYIKHCEDIDLSGFGSIDKLLVEMVLNPVGEEEYNEIMQTCRKIIS